MIRNIKLKHLRDIWTNNALVSDTLLTQVAIELSESLEIGNLDTELRLCHFLAQIVQEVGQEFQLEENMNYSASMLKNTFSFYRKNPEKAEEHGRTSIQAANPQAIANHAYAKRMGNGDASTNDGWKFKGKGLIQLTGKTNYIAFQNSHNDIWQESKNFIANPMLLLEPKYAVRSAIVFWLNNKLYLKADNGSSQAVTDSITAIVNKYTKSYAERHKNLLKLLDKKVFSHVYN